ncbi:hypothetical protein [Nocardiopsis nanhaiensis]
MFALTACSSAEDFDFTDTLREPAESIEFSVPDDLVDLDEEYAENRLFESMTLTAVESDDPSECAVEYEFDYADDGLERLIQFVEDTPNDDRSGEERMASLLTGSSESEMAEDYTSGVRTQSCATSPTDDENTVGASLGHIVEEDGDDPERVTFASARVAIMQGGELYVQEPEVAEEWELDSNGNWLRVGD